MAQVVLVDDHALVRSGLRMMLEATSDLEVAGEAGDAEAGLRLIRKLKPEVALVDVHLPGSSGLDLTERLRRSSIPTQVVILTAIENARLPRRLLQAGALGYLTKGCASEQLLAAVRSAARGQRYLAPELAQQLALDVVDGGDGSPFDKVAARELEVAMLLVRGKMLKEIGAELNISPKTVSTYKQRLFEKLDIDNTVALAHLLNAWGMGDPDVDLAEPTGG